MSNLAMHMVVNSGSEIKFLELAQTMTMGIQKYLSENSQTARVTEWEAGRFRKILHRARGNKFALLEDESVLRFDNLLFFHPMEDDERSRGLMRAQVSGTEITGFDEVPVFGASSPRPNISHNANASMSASKAVVALAHSAQLLFHRGITGPFHFSKFHDFDENDTVTMIEDSGFTEVEPGTVTSVSFL